MIFNEHPELEGLHAFLSPSKFHWVNYSKEKLIASYDSHMAVQRGTRLHEFAAECISLGETLTKKQKTLNMYVNDAIGFKMSPERPLKYSDRCFGTTDAICFRNKKLRIHDLKTGTTPAHMEQLLIYAALFCLEYNKKPEDISVELRIYQNNQIVYHLPEAEELQRYIDIIVEDDKVLMEAQENQEGSV